MPSPREYTPQRRRIMEILMCAVLLGTIGLAAVVTRSANRAHRIELSADALSRENVKVRLPLGWRMQASDASDARVIALATEASAGPGRVARVVRVLSDRIETPMSPLKYLHDAFGV